MTLREVVQKAEREYIVKVLCIHIGNGRLSRVAKSLGISRHALWKKMRKHGIDKTIESPQERLALGA